MTAYKHILWADVTGGRYLVVVTRPDGTVLSEKQIWVGWVDNGVVSSSILILDTLLSSVTQTYLVLYWDAIREAIRDQGLSIDLTSACWAAGRGLSLEGILQEGEGCSTP